MDYRQRRQTREQKQAPKAKEDKTDAEEKKEKKKEEDTGSASGSAAVRARAFMSDSEFPSLSSRRNFNGEVPIGANHDANHNVSAGNDVIEKPTVLDRRADTGMSPMRQLSFRSNRSRGRSYAGSNAGEVFDQMERGRDREVVPEKEPESYLPRLILRNRPFGQSANKVHIEHNQGVRIYSLLKHNWFHAFLRRPTKESMFILLSMWTGLILAFATLYIAYDNINKGTKCALGAEGSPMKFGEAFAFSLETCTTVGYGIPHGLNAFFEPECGSLQFLVYLQMAASMIFNACLLAFLYARLGRSETRSNQVINSRKALVSNVNGQVRFQVRLFDADAQHPVVEAHVRLYCVMNHRPVPRPLRLLQPDDDMGGMLFLSFPTVISHHIDLYSLLHPPASPEVGMVVPSGLVLRQADAKTNSRDDVICPVCGESYGTLGRWKNHVRYCQMAETKDNWPITEASHRSLNMEEIERYTSAANRLPTRNMNDLQEYFRQYVSEVICVVEGIDPLQSGTFQSLQSYRYEDIVWDEHSQWAPCLSILQQQKNKKSGTTTTTSSNRTFQVDLERYHDIVVDTDAVRLAEANRLAKEEAKHQATILAGQGQGQASGPVPVVPTPPEGTATSDLGAALSSSTRSATPTNIMDLSQVDSHPGLTAALESIFKDNLGLASEGAGNATADAALDGLLSNNSKPSRHRRVKSSSRRPGDGLFTPDEDLENKGETKHPLHTD